VGNGACVECHRVKCREWYATNRGHAIAYTRAWYAANRQHAVAYTRAWEVAHPDRYAALLGLHNARKRFPGCVPDDFDIAATERFYTEARRRTQETGIRHEVDHRVPLCLGGEHVARNLQVLTRKENCKKAKAEQAKANLRGAGR
jgi:hypothetical protein